MWVVDYSQHNDTDPMVWTDQLTDKNIPPGKKIQFAKQQHTGSVMIWVGNDIVCISMLQLYKLY